ncbi:MAG: penicillin acylase family protein [Ardenticatenia bacterium]|nr:penicillin acylase family protein [Ardenticatenia bacterium]
MNRRVVTLTLLAALTGGASALYDRLFRQPKPQTEGIVRLRGLHKPVQVIRDRWGIPHIFAHTDHDLFFAQGFVHAQDRLWQMEYWRRAAAGRLAEILGPEALPVDRWMRTLRIYASAEEAWPYHNDEARSAAMAYAEGVNALLEHQDNRWPPEFHLLRFEPQRWTPADSVAILRLMALTFSGDFQLELLRERLIALVGEETFHELWPAYPGYAPIIARPGLEALGAPFAQAGSNAWVVGPSRSANGAPLLANDPHMLLTSPPAWYEIHLHSPTYAVIGASLAGVPGVIIGHNAHMAWGVTNSLADCQDLYVERRHPEHPHLFQHGEEWMPARVYEERIFVRGTERPERLQVVVTHHGPLISPLLPGESRDIALRWTLYEPDNAIGTILQLNRATSWEEFRLAVAAFSAAPLNFCYADVEGHIGWTLGGRIPVRANHRGLVPVDGASGDYEWQGFLSADQLPSVFDPPADYVVHANNKPVDDEYPHWLGQDFFPRVPRPSHCRGHRGTHAARLEHVCRHPERYPLDPRVPLGPPCGYPSRGAARPAAAPSSTVQVGRPHGGRQRGGHGSLLHPNAPASPPAGRQAGPVDGRLRGTAVRPVRVRVDDAVGLPERGLAARAARGATEPLVARGRPAIPALARPRGARGFRGGRGLAHGAGEGSVPAWGSVNRLRLAHILGNHPLLRRIFERGGMPVDGGPFTVSASFRDIVPDNDGGLIIGPAWRFLADVSNWDRCRSSLPGGQCAIPGSHHFDDRLHDWLAGRYHPLLWSRQAIERETEARLELIPA